MAKKILALVLAMLMVVSLVACATTPDSGETTKGSNVANNDNKKDDKQEEVKEEITLEWYYRGNGIQRDTEAVNDYVNELLHQIEGFEHISVHLNPYLASDYATSVTLAQSTGEQIDILNTVGLNLVTEVGNGTFVALKDYLSTDEFSALKNEFPEWLWNAVSVGDSPYIVPHYQRGANMYYFCFPAKYAEGEDGVDVDAIRAAIADGFTVAELDDLMKQVVDAARKIEGVDTKYMWPAAGIMSYSNGIIYKEFVAGYGNTDGICIRAGSTTAENFWLSTDFKEAVESAAKANAEGYTLPDMILRSDVDSLCQAGAMNDEAIVVMVTNGGGTEEQVSAQYSKTWGYDAICIPIYDSYYMASSWAAGGDGVTTSSKHPEEALAFLQLINTEAGKEIYNTIVYGLEGTHYEKIDENHIKTLEYDGSQGSDNNYSAHKWIMGNTFNVWLNQGCTESDNEIALEINNNPNNVQSPCMGFTFDNSSVLTQLEQVKAVVTEYYDTLRLGAKGNDWEEVYNEFVAKMEAAGVQEIVDELQTQYDAFLASK